MNRRELILPDPVDNVSWLENRPSIFLSASVPYMRIPREFEPSDREAVEQINRRYVDGALPERIRAAVVALTRVALARPSRLPLERGKRDERPMRLVFGAHPSISPMILQAAQDMNAAADSILVFQSNAYRKIIPGSTLDLANWSRGRLILTRKKREAPFEPTTTPSSKKLKRLSPHTNSLRFMRQLMLSVPGLLGGVFIGGMNGVEEEAAMFEKLQPGKPRFALPSTGSAAMLLDKEFRDVFDGNASDRKTFLETPSYTVAASIILDQLLR